MEKEKVKEITEIVQTVLDSIEKNKKTREAAPKKGIAHLLEWCYSNKALFVFILSALTLLTGWAVFGISPLQPLEEIAHKQKEYRRKEKEIEFRNIIVRRHIELGNSFLNVFQTKAAHEEFEKALKLDPINVEAQFGLFKSDIINSIGNEKYNMEIIRKRLLMILKERKDDPHIFCFLGDLHKNIDVEESLTYYTKAIESDSMIAAAYFGIGVIYDQQGYTDKAMAMYKKAYQLSDWNAIFLNNLAYQYYQKGDYKAAAEKYSLLLKIDPRKLSAYYVLANAFRINGEMEEALKYQRHLEQLFEDTSITSLDMNKISWFFLTRDNCIYMHDYDAKKCYANYNFALTSYLMGDRVKAKEYIGKARNIKYKAEYTILELLYFDIQDLIKSGKVNKTQMVNFIEDLK